MVSRVGPTLLKWLSDSFAAGCISFEYDVCHVLGGVTAAVVLECIFRDVQAERRGRDGRGTGENRP